MWIDEWLFKEGLSQQKFAEKIGISRQYLNRIILGSARGSPDVAKKIQEITSKRGSAGASLGTTRIGEMPAVGILPEETPESGYPQVLARKLSMKSDKGVFNGRSSVVSAPISDQIIPSLYEYCLKSPGCMKK